MKFVDHMFWVWGIALWRKHSGETLSGSQSRKYEGTTSSCHSGWKVWLWGNQITDTQEGVAELNNVALTP
jgi:hypothetical protein